MDSEVWARKDKDGHKQTLSDHLHNTACLARDFEPRLQNLSYVAGLLHDFGKASDAFQEYLLEDKGARGSVIHSKQGAFLIQDEMRNSNDLYRVIAEEILEMCIACHHGDLPDCIRRNVSRGDLSFFDELTDEHKNEANYAYDQVKERLECIRHEFVREHKDECVREIENIWTQLTKNGEITKSFFFQLGLLVKYVYSRLVDADRLDAARFENHGMDHESPVSWEQLAENLDASMRSLREHAGAESKINHVRDAIFDACGKASERETGIYRLSVPTGGGKTLSSLHFALQHAMRHNKRRIIYVIPYLSITMQTSRVFKKVLQVEDKPDILLEHYSSAIDDAAITEEGESRRLAAERWNQPLIVTTMVQFLESVMSSRGTALRKFHNMADSIIIFDEIQSLPTSCINLFNEVASFLSSTMNTTIVLCSATQPLLEKTNRSNLTLAHHPDIVTLSDEQKKLFKRTEVIGVSESKNSDEYARFVYEKALENNGCLAIVNLKSAAREVYQELVELDMNDEFHIIHLSTAMCGLHKQDALADVQKCLLTGKPVICISTQLVEAGVDVSFPCVVRAMSGLDSVLQAAGRCNRNGEFGGLKKVYVVPMNDNNGIKNLNDIRIGKEITEQLVWENEDRDLLDDDLLRDYYSRFLQRLQPTSSHEANSVLDYVLHNPEGKYAYTLLSDNVHQQKEYEKRTNRYYSHVFAQEFKTVGREFKIIPNNRHNVIVMYKDAESVIEQFQHAETTQKQNMLQLLQKYAVSLFDHEYKKLEEKRAIFIIDEDYGVYGVTSEYYNSKSGIVPDGEGSSLFL